MKMMLVWSAVFSAHALAQFAAWAMADTSSGGRTVARVLMFPAFSVAGALADRWFWPTFVVNSALWASVATLLNWKATTRPKAG